MNQHNSKTQMKTLKYIIALGLVSGLPAASHAEPFSQWNENPALHAKFPMCDKFLNVEWISPERKIGVSRYMLYAKDGTPIRPINSLVFLSRYYPTLNYSGAYPPDTVDRRNPNTVDIPGSSGRVFLQEWQKDAIRDWDFINGWGDINYYEYQLEFCNEDRHCISIRYDSPEGELSQHTENVCIVYPDESRAWIYDFRDVGHEYTEQEQQDLLVQFGLLGRYTYFKEAAVFDANGDGILDIPTGLYFSYQGETYHFEKYEQGRDDEGWQFQGNGKVCHTLISSFYITTDGKDYYLNNECNLSELTREDH